MLNLFFPKFCLGCWRCGEYACENCLNTLPILSIQECVVCGRYTIDGQTHRFCSNSMFPTHYVSPYIYEGLIKRFISISKGEEGCLQSLIPLINSPSSLELLNRLFSIDPPNLIVPCPMTVKPFSYRLYNHSLYISKVIGKCFKLSVIDILRKKYSQSQKIQRKENRSLIEKSITIEHQNSSSIKGKRILLVDDVSTTGSTLLACSQKLLENGAKSVCCYTICKDLMYNIS